MVIPGRIEEALIQHRYGYSSDLPDYLEEAEIAFTVDDGGVFIGAPMFKAIDGRERALSNIYPYHNIRILTEVSDNAEIISVPFNPFNEALDMPIVLVGYKEPQITNIDVIAVNGVQLQINPTDTTLSSYVNRFNSKLSNAGINNLIFDTYNNKLRIVFYSSNNETLVLDSFTDQALQHFGLVNELETNVTHKVITPTGRTSRKLTDILSDRISIKTFGVSNNNNSDSSLLTNATISMLYRSTPEFLKKDIYFPAGQYNYSTDAIYLISDIKLYGEHNSELIFKNTNTNTMISNLDSMGYFPSVNAFGMNPERISNIVIDNINFTSQSDIPLNAFTLYGVNNFTLSNSYIKCNNAENIICTNIVEKINYSSSDKFVIENVTLDGAINAINLTSTSNVIIRNCLFKNITGTCINLLNCKNVLIDNCDFSDESISGILFNISNSSNIVIKNSTLPDNLDLSNGNNNKIKFYKSSVEIDNYITKEIQGNANTNILVFNINQENLVLKLSYDIYGSNFQDRSGNLISKVLNNSRIIQVNNINDSNYDSLLPFQISKNNSTITVLLNNQYSSNAFIRYKLSVIPL